MRTQQELDRTAALFSSEELRNPVTRQSLVERLRAIREARPDTIPKKAPLSS